MENLYSKGLIKNETDVTPIRIDVNIVENDVLNTDAFKKWRSEFMEGGDGEMNGDLLEPVNNIIGEIEGNKLQKSIMKLISPQLAINKLVSKTVSNAKKILKIHDNQSDEDANMNKKTQKKKHVKIQEFSSDESN
jgi:hypothetical protein